MNIRERIREDFALKASDGQQIRGTFSSTPGLSQCPIIVFSHGFGSDRKGEKIEAFETECAARGWGFAAFDFRGHGDSDGSMIELTGSRMIEDLDLVTNRIAELEGGSPLFLVGSSMGGWTSAWFDILNPGRVAACGFIAPAFRFLEFLRLTDHQKNEWQRTGRLRIENEFVDVEIGSRIISEADRFDFSDLASGYHTPAIIFHGMQDDLVPYTISLDFARLNATSAIHLYLFKDGDHRLNREKDRMARLACEFFAEIVGAASSIMV